VCNTATKYNCNSLQGLTENRGPENRGRFVVRSRDVLVNAVYSLSISLSVLVIFALKVESIMTCLST